MNTNIVITLDTRRSKKDGTFPIILRLSHQRKTIPVSTGFAIAKADWNEKSRKVKTSYKGAISVNRLNNLMSKKKTEAMEKITKLEDSGELPFLTINQVKSHLLNNLHSSSFIHFGKELIAEMKQAKQFGNADIYSQALSFLLRHSRKNDLSFLDVNYKFLKKIEVSHLAHGYSFNGLSVYLRAVRAIYRRGMAENLVPKEAYPFERYRIKSVPTRKRALSKGALEKILSLRLQPEHECFYTRNFFLASYMMYGMSYIDMAFLKIGDIIDGRIKYRRKKTSSQYDIKITEALSEILDHYMDGKSKEDFILPIIKRSVLEDQLKDVKWARKRYNKKLKELAVLCGIEEALTSYVSRHSFASNANALGIPVTAIKQMLGHKSINTTQVYLASLEDALLDKFNEQILQSK